MPDIKTEFSRTYALVNPNPAAGPPTWLLATAGSLGISGGGGGAGGTNYTFSGVMPIDVDTVPGTGGAPHQVETSMDIAQLDDRAD